MDDLQAWVGTTYGQLADLLAASEDAWTGSSLCEGWQARHVIAHVTMPARLTPAQFGEGMAAAGGDFTRFSDAVAERDAERPREDLLGDLRSPVLHGWQPPGGGAAGALSHAVIHSLDVTIPLGAPPVAPPGAVDAVLQQLANSNGSTFGLDLTGRRLEAADTGWTWGSGDPVTGDSGSLVALLSGRTLPDGRSLRRA